MIPDAFVGSLGYLAVLLGTMVEGEGVLALAGLAAQHGYLSFPAVVALAVLGAFLGDQFFYFLGKRYGNRLLARYPSLATRAPRIQALLRRWDVVAIVLMRFLYGMRIAGPIVIGSSGIPAWRLAVCNLMGALIWAPLVAGIGYFAGHALETWVGRLHHVAIIALMIIALGSVLAWIAMQSRKR
jgi:membrane protein DedA with SNARE-associated domain